MPIVAYKRCLSSTDNRCFCFVFAHSVLLQIFFTPKSFSWHEVLKVGGAENHSPVAPSGHILLPFGDCVIGICRVTVWLCVGVHGSAFMVLAKTLQSLPPVVQTVVTFPEVVLTAYHGVEEVFATESCIIDKLHGSLTFRYLCRSVATEADARVYPFHLA